MGEHMRRGAVYGGRARTCRSKVVIAVPSTVASGARQVTRIAHGGAKVPRWRTFSGTWARGDGARGAVIA